MNISDQKNEKLTAKEKIFIIAVLAVIIVAVAGVLIYKNVIKPSRLYAQAVEQMNSGDYIGAYNGFLDLGNYRDSAAKLKSIEDEFCAATVQEADVEKMVFFGKYEQDNDAADGKEPIEWIAIARDGEKLLLVSRYAIDCKRYNDTYEKTTWETCSLRKWLNGEFLNEAFTAEEAAKIVETKVTADENTEYDTDPGNDTEDKIFLLSVTETGEYFNMLGDFFLYLKCTPTEYAKANGEASTNEFCCWWLRTPGSNEECAAFVGSSGAVRTAGYGINLNYYCVRPAMWINPNA